MKREDLPFIKNRMNHGQTKNFNLSPCFWLKNSLLIQYFYIFEESGYWGQKNSHVYFSVSKFCKNSLLSLQGFFRCFESLCINSSSDLNITVNTTLNINLSSFLLVHLLPLSNKQKLVGGAFKLFTKKLLRHKTFSSMVSWAPLFFEKFESLQGRSEGSSSVAFDVLIINFQTCFKDFFNFNCLMLNFCFPKRCIFCRQRTRVLIFSY